MPKTIETTTLTEAFSVRLPPDVKREIQRQAQEQRRSAASVIRWLLESVLENALKARKK